MFSRSLEMQARSLFIAAVFFFAGSAAARGLPTMEVQPGNARPGDVVVVRVRHAGTLPLGTLGERSLSFWPYRGGYLALAGLSTKEAEGMVPVTVEIPGAIEGSAPVAKMEGFVEVLPANFRERELKVDNKFVSPPATVKKRIKEDREAFALAFKQSSSKPIFRRSFIWPRNDELTAFFGDRRSFNKKLQSQHFGIDLNGNTGDPIYASNDAEAVLVRDCYSSGLTVVLFHGADVFTVYFHLSKVDVKQGDRVKRGQRLGEVGKSGRVTGPHLHWGVKINGHYVNGQSLVEADLG